MSEPVAKEFRLATKEDIPVVVKFAENFYRVSGYNTMRFSRQRTRSVVEAIVNDGGFSQVAILALHEGKPVGMVVAIAAQPPFTEEKVSSELAWWVEPEFRSSRLALRLFDAYETWAKTIGCTHIQSAYLTQTSPKGLDKFYERKGYIPVENSFLKKIKEGV